jgi:hypothetical protein
MWFLSFSVNFVTVSGFLNSYEVEIFNASTYVYATIGSKQTSLKLVTLMK